MRTEERLKVIYETIAPAITRNETAWKDYLKFGSQVYKHSFDNALLVYAQNPKTTMLATTPIWNKVGRYINKGEKGIAVCEYENAKLTLKHLFDVTQTNGKAAPEQWVLDEEKAQALSDRLSYSHNITATNLNDCISQIVDNTLAESIDDYLQDFETDIKDHFLGTLPQDGLISELTETIENSCKYFIACKCGVETDYEPSMPTISHFDTVPLVTRLGYTVTEISKRVLLEIARNVRIIDTERRSQNEQRNHEQQRASRNAERSATGERNAGRGRTDRQIRKDGDGLSAPKQSPKVFTFEDDRRTDGENEGGGRGSEEQSGGNHAKAPEPRPAAADGRYTGENPPLQQAEGHSGGNRTERVGVRSEIAKPEREPQGSFSLLENQGTPLWRQYEALLYEYPDSIVFRRLGDFYEVMGWDAKTVADELRLTITSRDVGLTERVPMVGIPDHAFDANVKDLISRGYSVVIAEAETVTERKAVEPQNTLSDEKNDIENITLNAPDNGGEQMKLTDISVPKRSASDLFREYSARFTSRVLFDESYLHAREGFSDAVNAKAECGAAIDRYMQKISAEETELFNVYNNDPAFVNRLVDYVFDKTFTDFVKQAKRLDRLFNSAPKPPNDTIHRNYAAFTKLFPQIADGTYRYMRLESDGFEPLSVERLGGNQISIMHTFTQNGDLMRDPDMVLELDPNEQTIQALSYELSSMGLYQDVYASGNPNSKLQKDLNSFLSDWLRNIRQQEYSPVRAVAIQNGEDVDIKFDEQESATPLAPSQQAESAETEIRITAEALNAHHGQVDMQIKAYSGEDIVGRLDYSVFEGIPQIQFIEVFEDYRRQGIGTKMVQALAEQFSDVEIEWSNTTDDGTAFKEAVTYTVENTEYTDMQSRLAEIEAQLAQNDLEADDGKVFSGEEANAWNDLHDEKYELEQFLIELNPTITHIKTGAVKETDVVMDGSGGLVETVPDETAVTITAVTQEKPVAPIKTNYRYSETDNLYSGGAKSKFKANIEAIKLLQRLESEKRNATPDEQKILANYVGWGGLANAFSDTASGWENEYQELKLLLDEDEYKSAMNSTITAYYTEPKLIEHMYKALGNFGFNGGSNRKILDPAMGTGNFYSVLPDNLQNTKLFGVELDSLTGRIAKQLYPTADISVQGFETTRFADNSFDIAIGNIPFNNIKLYDKRYEEQDFMIHDYFIAKSLDLVKPGGIVAFITSKGTMDKRDTTVREYIAERADLIGAVRLPNTAFKQLAGTEVTADILFLKKRDEMVNIRQNPPLTTPDWVYSETRADYLRLNQYFIDNPDMILGEMQQSRNMYGREDGTACIAPAGQDLYAELDRAIGKLSAAFTAEPDKPVVKSAQNVETTSDEEENRIEAPEGTKNCTYVIQDNSIFYCENGWLVPQDIKGKKAERIKGLCEVKTALQAVVAVQSREYQYNELEAAQKKLNEVYDSFVPKNGYINSKANIAAFSDDDQFALLRSIEDLNDDKETYSKAPIFTRATIKSYRRPTHADSAKEALEISLNMKMKVDLAYMSSLYEKSEDEIITELGERSYLNPQKYYGNPYEGWETAEEYLSGDVAAKLAYARLKAEENPIFERNVAALQDVQPPMLMPSDINFRIGSPWIPKEYFAQFMYETFDTPSYLTNSIEIEYLEYTTQWRIGGKNQDHSIKVDQTYGTGRVNAYEIYEDCLNLQSTTVRDPKPYTDANGKDQVRYVINATETMIARAKQQQIKEAFANWLFRDKDRTEILLKIYNETFNTIRPREYDGAHLVFPNLNEERDLRPHQKNVAARIIYSGTCLMAHEVGAGYVKLKVM